MGFLAKLFGWEHAQTNNEGSYEQRLQEQANQIQQSHDTAVAGPQVSPWGDGGDPPEQKKSNTEGADEVQNPYRDAKGRKIIPEVSFERVEPKLSNDREKLEVWATVRNESDMEIEIREIELIKQDVMPGRFLKPGETFELRIYRGDTPKTDDYDDCFVRYRVVGNDDYFESKQHVEFDYDEPYYVPTEISRVQPVRDI